MSETIIKKIAVFEYVAGGDMSCMAGVQFATDHNRTDVNVIRVTEWIDVEFTKCIDNNIQERLDFINESKSKCYDEIGLIKAKLIELRKQKKEINDLIGDVL